MTKGQSCLLSVACLRLISRRPLHKHAKMRIGSRVCGSSDAMQTCTRKSLATQIPRIKNPLTTQPLDERARAARGTSWGFGASSLTESCLRYCLSSWFCLRSGGIYPASSSLRSAKRIQAQDMKALGSQLFKNPTETQPPTLLGAQPQKINPAGT